MCDDLSSMLHQNCCTLGFCQMDRARTLQAAEHFLNACSEVVEMVVGMVKLRDMVGKNM